VVSAPGEAAERAPAPASRPRRATPAPPRSGDASLAAARSELAVVSSYDREIERLRAAMQQRRGELDSTTVAVIEENLALIDRAIAESRSALARDPRSGFLIQQLTNALDRKVELLRTVATLPARS
jgi:hypothetical protein